MTTDTTFNITVQNPFLSPAIATANGSVTAETAFWPRDQSSTLIMTLTLPQSTWAVAVNSSMVAIKSANRVLTSVTLPPRQQAKVSSGVVLGMWNILRFEVVHAARGHSLSVWLNPIAQPTAPHLGSVRPLLSTTVPNTRLRVRESAVEVGLEVGVGVPGDWSLLDYVSVLGP